MGFTPALSDDAVKARTGKTWPQWFSVLDRAGAKEMSHQEIVAYLRDKQGVGPWWQQMVTNTYEQHIGRRQKHEMAGGFQVGGTKTINVPVSQLYLAWKDGKARARWLPERTLSISKATPNKSLRILWAGGKTRVDVNLYAKGDSKSQVQLEHSKLANAKEAERMKAFWAKALSNLKELLEG